MKKVCIIGGGISGLSAGIYLLQQGYEVEIYEKNNSVGGFLQNWKRKGVEIDGCLHWMCGTNENSKLYKVWKHLGVFEDVKFFHPISFYDVRFEHDTFHFYQDINLLEKEFLRFSKNDEEEIASLIKAIKALGMYEPNTEIPYELSDLANKGLDLRTLVRVRKYLNITVEELASRFNSEEIKYSLYHSIINRKFSAFYFLQTLSNFCLKNDSLPIGGTRFVQNRLEEKYLKEGGKLYLNSPVNKILIKEGVTKGVTLENGKIVESDYVVSTCDMHFVKEKLLENKFDLGDYERMDKDKERYHTYSFVIATYKVKNELPNTTVAEVEKVSEYELFSRKMHHISYRQYGYEPSLVNDKNETTIQVMVTTNEDDYNYLESLSKEEYISFKDKVGRLMKEKLQELYPALEMECVDVLTPLTYKRYLNSYKGSFMTYALPPNERVDICKMTLEGAKNLVLANQWITLPGGTPMAIINGKFACSMILYLDDKDYKIED